MPLEDDIYLGAATGTGAQTTGGGSAGFNVGAATVGIGPTGRMMVYDIVPTTISATNLCSSQSPGTAALTFFPTTGFTSTSVNGQTVYQADVPRILRFTSGGNDTGITFNVAGYDQYGQAMTENVTGASGGVASGKKAFGFVRSITPSASVSSTVTVGNGDIFGLPVCVPDKTYVSSVQWNNTLAKDTGTLTTAVLTAATATTGDVRGTYAPQTGASDGVKRLVMTILLSSAQVGSAATRASALGVTQA